MSLSCVPCWVLTAFLAGNQPVPVPMSVQLPLILKVLSAERNRPLEARSVLVIGIVCRRASTESMEAAGHLVTQIEKATAGEWAPPLRFELVELSDGRDTASSVARAGPDILYVTPLPGADVEALVRLTRARKILTFTGAPALVRLGLSVGFELRKGETKILINRRASVAEGADFSSKLLKLADVIE